ncbi:MAG: hypothetical protein ACX94C_05980 [Phycisphaerales bacterium]
MTGCVELNASRSWRFMAVLLLSFGFVSTAFADVGQVNGLLRRAEANLESVNASIGHRTTPPTGSAAKLSAMRLQQALDDLNPAKELLEQIPAGTEGRAEAAERYVNAANLYNKLRTILTGSDAPAAAADSGGTKLNYQQEEKLSNARFHVTEVESNASQLTARLEELREVEDELSISYREVDQLMSVVENAKLKSGYAKSAMERLPEDGKGVADVRQRLTNADAKVVTAADFLRPLQKKLHNLIDPKNYPDFDADQKRLRELSAMFARPEMLVTQRALAAETYQQAEAAKAECIRMARKYARIVQQKTAQGERIEAYGNGFLRNHAAFMARAEELKGELPGEIRSHLDEAKRYADEAVKNQKPAWFNGGIPQQMDFARDRAALLRVIDSEQGKTLDAEIEQAEATLKQQAESLRELIIRENEMPADRFTGEDRKKAIETAISGWRVQQKEFKVLKVRIPSESWSRETKWTYSNGTWYYSDRSRLQVRLLIADHENPELAIDRAINVIKDHQKGDSMIGVPLRGFEDELPPSSYMLRSKIR